MSNRPDVEAGELLTDFSASGVGDWTLEMKAIGVGLGNAKKSISSIAQQSKDPMMPFSVCSPFVS